MKRTTVAAATLVAALLVAATGAAHWHPRARPLLVRVGPPRPVGLVVHVAGRPTALVDFDVEPKATRIFVDGAFRGTCDELDGHPQKLALRPGRHHLRLVAPDGATVERQIEAVAGHEVEVDLEP